ncbi:hypothetical protein niasHT_004016 [Heterodera trifolii]|uniref:Metalloendopeptidase n=1 Tax=Heterodera trifolii TaxID=157864 RepID=A0ABD2LTI3_9BILA
MNFFNLLTIFLCLVTNCSAPPIRPLSSDVGIWKTCNGKNGIILVENGCTKLLICYQSEMAKNRKISKRIGVGKGTIGKLKFVECAEGISEDQWHGLIIAKHQDGVISYESRQFEIEKYFKNMNLKLKLSHGFDDILGTEQIKETEKYLEINLTKNAEPLGNELQEALSSAAFFDDFMPFVLAFEFGAKFCAENGGTTKLCKEKCLSQTLVATKTKAPFVGTSKFHDTTPRLVPKTTFGIVPTTEQTFGFVPFARHSDHFGTNCTNIFFPMEVNKFMLNITITPYDVACKKYQRPLKMKDPEGPPSEKHRCFDACNKVPTEEKCENFEELVGCYKSSKKWPGNNPIAEICKKHLEGISGGADANANVAGFIVKICAHRNENDLVIESTFSISFSNETCKRTRTFPISLEKITDITNWMPTFLIEFGIDQWKSAIREKGDEKIICEGLKTRDGNGTILNDIEPQIIDGTLAKMIHFMPPSNDDKMLPFFQIERPKFSKFINNDTDLLPYQDDPNKFNNPDPCDEYGADCVPIKNLLLKIEALANCGKNESKNNAAFKKPDWAPLPPAMPWKKPSETMLCGGDMFCDKRTLREQYNRLREICGLQPEKVESQRKKRQYVPNSKWTKLIKIAMNMKNLPKDGYQKWKDAMKIGADLIMEVTCVRFEFVDEMVKGENGIAVQTGYGDGACGASPFGRVGGWQFLALGMTDQWCIDNFNMSVAAGHELMHALGFRHEQSRSDGRNYIILRENDGQSEIDPNTENFGFPYDFGSVMHYRADGDHEQGLYKLITLPRFYQQTIGQTERISFKDAAIINQIYCEDSCKSHEDKCENGGYLNPNDCTKCHCPDGYGGEYCKELEENLNCEDLSGIPRELVANQSAVLLKTKAKCGGNWPCRCHWQIKPEAGKKVRIQFKSLSNLFECTHNCSSAYVEVKYRADKRAQGAKLCCPRALTDLNANEYKNWIEAEKPDTDIVISAHLSLNWAVPSTVFELTYESGKKNCNVKLINSSKCPYPGNLYAEKRNPGIGTLECYDEIKQQTFECLCKDGDEKCLTEQKWAHDSFNCRIIKVNGIQVHGGKRVFGPKDPRYNWTRIEVDCYKAEGGTVSFWGYSKPDTKEIIRVDEVQCLMDDEVAGVPKRFKSLQTEEHPSMRKLSQSPFFANNASSLIHVFVPFDGHP